MGSVEREGWWWWKQWTHGGQEKQYHEANTWAWRLNCQHLEVVDLKPNWLDWETKYSYATFQRLWRIAYSEIYSWIKEAETQQSGIEPWKRNQTTRGCQKQSGLWNEQT